MEKKNCIFCNIIKRKISSNIVYEDDYVLAFLDIQPINDGHVLIVPKEHSALISDVDEAVAARMFNIAQKVNSAIRKSDLKAEGVNFWLADGEAAFQDVFHSHLHCIPRFKGDGFKLQLPEDYKNLPTGDELKSVLTEIKANIQ